MRFYGYLFCYCVHKIKIWLMQFLANAIFFRSQKSHKARTLRSSFKKRLTQNLLNHIDLHRIRRLLWSPTTLGTLMDKKPEWKCPNLHICSTFLHFQLSLICFESRKKYNIPKKNCSKKENSKFLMTLFLLLCFWWLESLATLVSSYTFILWEISQAHKYTKLHFHIQGPIHFKLLN